MRRADSICRQAIATTRRKQLSRLLESLELMTAVKPHTEQEAADKEATIADLLQRNGVADPPPAARLKVAPSPSQVAVHFATAPARNV